ncbi:hypothetical protein XENORESO_007318 [Xenotaenia resolanae]|uniref:Uncharacterized protein n=1 Tax=Xenotaenia resolanae TaxID=208358 RepID=A0ABV0VPU8_9TELE
MVILATVASDQFVNSLLTTTWYFHPHNCCSLNILSFRTIPCKPERRFCLKTPVDQQFLKHRLTLATKPSHLNTVSSPSDAQVKSQKVVFTMSKCLQYSQKCKPCCV